MIGAVCEAFEHYYGIFSETNDLSGLKEEYDKYLVNKGRQVRVSDPMEYFEGEAVGITDLGELIVDTEKGRRLVFAGEVSVRGIYGYV